MNEVFSKALKHPIGTACLIGAITGGVVKIIKAVVDAKMKTSTPKTDDSAN